MKGKQFLYIFLSIAWLSLIFWDFKKVAPVVNLLDYSSGVLSLKNRDHENTPLSLENTGFKGDIIIDSLGIPHIFGKSSNDVAFAIGYMHAKDRYFQMEMMTRVVQGKLAEVLGPNVTDYDTFWRPYHFNDMAMSSLNDLKQSDPGTYNYILSYGKGINYYLSNSKKEDRFFEYIMLGFEPREWEDHYVLLLSYYMSHILTYNDYGVPWQKHLNKVPNYVIQQLYSYDFNDYSTIYTDSFYVDIDSNGTLLDAGIKMSDNMAGDFNFQKVLDKRGLGSNNWAISKTLSKTGNAILCNDPHLDMNLPGPWYQAHLVCDEFNVHGFTIPCSPFVISGHNEKIAWGITNAQWDLVDNYSLTMNKEKTSYSNNGAWVPFRVDIDTILVKGAGDIVLTTKSMPLGRLIEENDSSDIGIIERWYSAEKDFSALTFGQLAKANGWSDFYKALEIYQSPPQNFVYADMEGNVGMITAGKLPYRPETYYGQIVPIEKAFADQTVPFKIHPHQLPDTSGFACSANQKQAHTNFYLHHDWVEDYRGSRIKQYLTSDTSFGVEDMKQLHADLIDLSFEDIKPLLDSNAMDYEKLMFKNWKGEMAYNSAEAKHFFFFKQAIYRQFDTILNKEFGTRWLPNFGNMVNYMKQNDTLRIGSQLITTKSIIQKAFKYAKEYETLWNEKNDNGNFGTINDFQLTHISLPGIGKTFTNKGGTSNTLNVSSGINHGSSMRTIIEMGENVNVWTIQGGGQSGKFNSPNYDNQVESWLGVKYKKISFSKNKTDIIGVRKISVE